MKKMESSKTPSFNIKFQYKISRSTQNVKEVIQNTEKKLFKTPKMSLQIIFII